MNARARVLLLAPLLACASPALAQEKPDHLAEQARAVLRKHCARCHNGDGSEGGNFDVLKRANLFDKDLAVAPLVVENDPDKSLLYKRVKSGSMPPRAVAERPTAEDLEVIKKWIKAGAPDFATKAKNPFIPVKAVLKAIRDDLDAADSDDRPYLRYFTLHNLHNSGVSGADFRLFQAALSKALNSLSHEKDIVVPRRVKVALGKGEDPGVLFAIDQRKLGWTLAVWEGIRKHYPYGLIYSDHPDKELAKYSDDIRRLSKKGNARVSFVHVRADWFVATATRPPLYHWVLDIPEKAHELEKQLGVDVARNLLDKEARGRALRAGFARSGVSGQNRLVERHTSDRGGYWKSYDFKADSGRSKLVRFPLGPRALFDRHGKAVKNEFVDFDFVHDGGEIIFPLRNNLQGYMLIKGDDSRIDEGPIEVVSDSLKTSGTPVIVNGLSCMACHSHGIRPFKDTIRKGSVAEGEFLKKVEDLYPDDKVMNKLVEKDSKQFLEALGEATRPFLLVGPDKGRKITDFEEPIGTLARRYRLAYLGRDDLAAELDVETWAEVEKEAGREGLKKLGLEALMDPKGQALVPRSEWEAVEGNSLMQQVALFLKATPSAPLRSALYPWKRK